MKQAKFLLIFLLSAGLCKSQINTFSPPAPNESTAYGDGALNLTATGMDNVAVGKNSLLYTTTGHHNTAVGAAALALNTTGAGNTALGAFSQVYGQNSIFNTSLGAYALEYNSTGSFNAAVGYQSLISNTTGTQNVGVGALSLFNNGSGGANVALGNYSLYTNTTGSFNSAIGYHSLYVNQTGAYNNALGNLALERSSGSGNIAIGNEAGRYLLSGDQNILIGYNVDAVNNQGSNQLNIGNWIYGVGGNIGIGVPSPAAKLHVNGTVRFDGLTSQPTMPLVLATDANGMIYTRDAATMGFWQKNSSNNLYYNISNSSVGIGTSTPNSNAKLEVAGNVYVNSKLYIGTPDDNTTSQLTNYSLAVNGNAIFNNAKVKLYGQWPDYVFENNYKLMPLDKLENYITANKHLPEMPGAAEVEKSSAVDIGETQKMLLQKVEELTLYVIQLKKEIDALKSKN